MELPTLIDKVLEKAAPISALEKSKIITDCRVWYEGLVKAANDKKTAGTPLNLLDKIILQADSWYFRLALTLSYFVIISFIQGILNPSTEHDEYEDQPK